MSLLLPVRVAADGGLYARMTPLERNVRHMLVWYFGASAATPLSPLL